MQDDIERTYWDIFVSSMVLGFMYVNFDIIEYAFVTHLKYVAIYILIRTRWEEKKFMDVFAFFMLLTFNWITYNGIEMAFEDNWEFFVIYYVSRLKWK